MSLCVAMGLGASAHAHHSHFYDECKSIAIEGRVERVEFKKPTPSAYPPNCDRQ